MSVTLASIELVLKQLPVFPGVLSDGTCTQYAYSAPLGRPITSLQTKHA